MIGAIQGLVGLGGTAASSGMAGAASAFQTAESGRMLLEGMKATRIANDNTIISSNLGNAKGINF